MEMYPDVFPVIYTNLIRVGELSGALEESLNQAANYLDRSTLLSKQIKRILIPNLVEFIVLLILLFVGSLIVIPIMQDVLDTMGSTAKLPAITVWFSKTLKAFTAVWWKYAIVIGIIVGLVIVYFKTPTGKYKWDYIKYTGKVFGKLNFAIDFSRFIESMELNLNNGLRVQEALETSKNVTNNYVMIAIIEKAIDNIIVRRFMDRAI